MGLLWLWRSWFKVCKVRFLAVPEMSMCLPATFFCFRELIASSSSVIVAALFSRPSLFSAVCWKRLSSFSLLLAQFGSWKNPFDWVTGCTWNVQVPARNLHLLPRAHRFIVFCHHRCTLFSAVCQYVALLETTPIGNSLFGHFLLTQRGKPTYSYAREVWVLRRFKYQNLRNHTVLSNRISNNIIAYP